MIGVSALGQMGPRQVKLWYAPRIADRKHVYWRDTIDARMKQHYMACYRHSDRCVRGRCKGWDHRKYMLHREAAPHLWVTIPIAVPIRVRRGLRGS